MPQFDFSVYFSQIFWMCVSFGLLFWAMHRCVMPKITQLRHQRHERRRSVLQHAQDWHERTEVLLQEVEEKLRQARGDASKIVSDALAISEKQLQESLYAHQQSYHAQMEALKKTIESERVQAWKTLYDSVPELSETVIKKWSQKNLHQEKS